MDSDKREVLLVEYQKAQDSAEHHDTLLWTVSGLILGGMAVLFGFAVQSGCISVPRWFLPAMGLLLTLTLSFFVENFAHIRKQKYDRCKEIEQHFGMKQHHCLDHPKPWLPAKPWLRGWRGRLHQRTWLHLVNLLFVLGWVYILVK